MRSSTLAALAHIHYGKSPSEVLSVDGPFPIVGTGGAYGQASSAMFPEGVVVARKGSLGTPHLLTSPFWPVDTTYAVVPRAEVDLRWLYYSLSNFDLTKLNEATGVPSINRNWLAKINLSNPGYDRQKKIAAILSSIDTTIEKTEALIEKYQQIKAGLMHDLFTRGVLPNGRLRPPREQAPELYQETAIGWIPKDWVLSRCAQAFSIDSGITLGPHRRPARRPHPYLRVANVYRDEIRLDDVAGLEVFSGEADYSLRKFDLLVVEGHANRAEIGRCAMVDDNAEGMLFQNHLFRLRACALEPRFGLLWLNSHFARRYWDATCSTSSGLNTINRKMLGAMPVCIPPRGEQDRIVFAAFAHREAFARQSNSLRKLKLQKFGLMQDILSGKVPVKVGAGETAIAG